jgi:hypothetical protein
VIDYLGLKGGMMKHTRLAFALLASAMTLVAADPFVGTWKLNSAKTKYKEGTAPKEQSVTITESGKDLIIKVAGVAGNGSPIALSYSVPATGGEGKLIEGTGYDGIAGKRHGANERETLYKKGGKTVYTTHAKITDDGNTLAVTTKGINPVGQKVEGETVYDKQK